MKLKLFLDTIAPPPLGCRGGFFLLYFLFTTTLQAQLETAHWYFGRNAGLDFTSGSPVAVTDGMLDTSEGCASISDECGNLLFYTDGVIVYDRNHNVMPNGTGLYGHSSSTQSAIIVPKSGSDHLYYIFTVDYTGAVPHKGLRYSLIDMSLNSGGGDVVSGEKNILLWIDGQTRVAEKLAVIPSAEFDGYWVVTHYKDAFYSFEVNENGVNPNPAISTVGLVINWTNNSSGAGIGYLKASPDGTKIAVAHSSIISDNTLVGDGALAVYDFNRETGEITNENVIYNSIESGINRKYYGIEFSPDGKFLYATYQLSPTFITNLSQYNLNEEPISSSEVILHTLEVPNYAGALQLGLNNKIYRTNNNSNNNSYLSVISQPNDIYDPSSGSDPGFIQDAVYLEGKKSSFGLPPFIHFRTRILLSEQEEGIYEVTNEREFCLGESFLFEFTGCMDKVSSVHWDFGDGNTSSDLNPEYTYASPGTYTVNLEITVLGNIYTAETEIAIHPLPDVQNAELEKCALENEEIEFDLTESYPQINPNGEDIVCSFHLSEEDAENNVNPQSLDYFTTSSTTLWVRVENEWGCISIVQLELIVNPIPEALIESPVEVCTGSPAILEVTTAFDNTVNWYDSATAITPIFTGNPFETPSLITTTSYWVEVADSNCTSERTEVVVEVIELIISEFDIDNHYCENEEVDPLPNTSDNGIPGTWSPLQIDTSILGTHSYIFTPDTEEACAEPFELIVEIEETIIPQFHLEELYCENTEADELPITANNGITGTWFPSEIDTSTTGVQTYTFTPNTEQCATEFTIDITITPSPEIHPIIPPYELCDNDQDGVESFDLPSHPIGNTGNFPVTFYNSQEDAEAPENAIVNPEDYISAGAETIYFRVDNTTTGCYTISSFNLIILPDPVHGIPEPYAICEDVSEGGIGEFDLTTVIPSISLGNPLISVTFYEEEADAIAGLGEIGMDYTNTTAYLQTIYVRVRDISTGCFVVITLDLVVNEIPEITTPDPLEICDPDNDGSGEFNLTLADEQITGGDPNLSVTYHETPENAELGLLPLASPYTNIDDYNQILYVRVEDQTTGCYNTTTLELIVYDSPQLIAPEPLIGCDDNNDGIAIFDLTQVADGIFGNYGEDWDTLFSIFYYETQSDADNGTNPIPNPGSYANLSNPQTIYIVAEDLDNECQKQTTLTLIVNPAPELNEPDPLELCDYNEPTGVEEFNLALAIPQITGGDTGIGVSFHLTQAEADNNENPLPLLYTNAVPYAQTLFVRATNATTGCSASTVTLTLRVNPLPSPEEPEPLVVCDTNTNGFSLFDLESKTDEILNGEADVIITYHELLFHAEEGIFAIDTDELYENIIPFEQTIYVRAENTITGCYTIVELLLIVEDAPTIPLTLEDLIACSEGQEEIGVLFDLTEHLEAIYGEQSDEDFSVTFHISEEDAENQDNAIANPESYPNIVNPQQIWYVLSNDETGCGNIGHFWLRVELPPDIIDPDPLEICDDEEADGITVFNLTDKNEEITQGQNWLDVQYYENEIDAIEGNEANRINPDTAYTNLTNLQLLYVRVVDIDTGCEAHTTLLLRVLNNPDIITPAPLEACDDTDPGNGIESFNLRDREDELLNGEVGVMVTYHESYEDAVAGTPAIDDPEDYEMTEAPQQIIYVRVTYDTTGCYSIVELLLIVHPLPQVEPGDIPDYILCLIPAVDQASFDLLEKRQEILDLYAPNQDDYEVTFHLEEAWAEAGIQSIPEFQLGNYLNLSNPQTIYYRIVHQTTSCANVGSFTLEIREGATITAPTAPLETCEDEQGSGIGTFNLTQLNGLLLGGQDPDVYQVTYHESEEDANATDANDTAIPNPESYQSGNAVIWGRVTNNDGSSQGLCYEITPITLQVNPLPEISLLSEYRLCVDEDGNAIQEEFGEQSPPLIDTGLPADQYSFVWLHNGQVLFGENGPSIVVTQEGEYTVIVTDITTGCENQASTTVILSSPPLDYGAETTTLAFANEHIIEAWAEGLGEYMFQLDDGPFQDEGYWTGMSPGIHVVTITDINGCGSVQIEVGVIDYPLFFTPNEDGYHDTWNIIGIGTDPTAKIYIFDRHGKLLKQLSPTGPGWDGTYNGSPVPSSDYWFRVVYTEDERQKEFRGHFTLKR